MSPESAKWYDDDEQLAEELAVALQSDPPSADGVAMVMAGYDIVMTDTLEAELILDSATDELAAVRSASPTVGSVDGARMITFADPTGELEIEFEVVDGRIVGHVDPPSGGTVRLEQPSNRSEMVAECEPDDLGSFDFYLRSPGTFRLRYVDADGRSMATGWIDGPHPTTDS